MTTNYDPIAELYKRAKQQPWRAHIEAFTLMRLIGDPTGKKVIDIACGEGFYTRMIRQRGAAKVTGVDLSEKMIGLARESEAQQRLGIDYILGDGRNLEIPKEYDLAVAAYFLNYAHDRAELNAMCSGIARCLRSGGRCGHRSFVCLPRQSHRAPPHNWGGNESDSASRAKSSQDRAFAAHQALASGCIATAMCPTHSVPPEAGRHR